MAQVSQGEAEPAQAPQGSADRQQLAIGGPSIHQQLAVDSPSDNDSNEKSAREKFKKTSIASLYKQTTPLEAGFQSEKDPDATETLGDVVPKSTDITEDGSRGRSAGKRALEDQDDGTSEHDSGVDSELQPGTPNGHTRKRSRDVRAGEDVKGSGRPQASLQEPLMEESEDFTASEERGASVEYRLGDNVTHNTYRHEHTGNSADPKPQETPIFSSLNHELVSGGARQSQSLSLEGEGKCEDEEMKDGTVSPRKKRSRDQLDAVADREQKIAATEETRAQRRSEELERANASSLGLATQQYTSGHAATTASAAKITNDDKIDTSESEAPKATFGATNMLRPSLGSSTAQSAKKVSDNGLTGPEAASGSTQSAFASSGFANFASSSNSPFGAIESSSNSTVPNLATFAKPPAEVKGSGNFELMGSSSFVPFSKASSANLGNNQLSSFASAGSKAGTSLKGAPFGSSFGGAFGGGSKLSSFAAPNGDAKLGSANRFVKPIGFSDNDDEEKDGSDTEEEEDDNGNKNDETIETEDKFQHQNVNTGEDGEDTIFSARAKLFAFKENNWKEAGNGTFKLNVISSRDSEDKFKGSRFIMRAHQTYRVLLNQPAFTQIKVGDEQGSEPTGRTFAFAVIEDGKPIPHMVRVCKHVASNISTYTDFTSLVTLVKARSSITNLQSYDILRFRKRRKNWIPRDRFERVPSSDRLNKHSHCKEILTTTLSTITLRLDLQQVTRTVFDDEGSPHQRIGRHTKNCQE